MKSNNPLVWCETPETWLASPTTARSTAKRTTTRKKAIAQAVLVLAALAGGVSVAHATVFFAGASVNPGLDADALATGVGSIAAGIASTGVGPLFNCDRHASATRVGLYSAAFGAQSARSAMARLRRAFRQRRQARFRLRRACNRPQQTTARLRRACKRPRWAIARPRLASVPMQRATTQWPLARKRKRPARMPPRSVTCRPQRHGLLRWRRLSSGGGRLQYRDRLSGHCQRAWAAMAFGAIRAGDRRQCRCVFGYGATATAGGALWRSATTRCCDAGQQRRIGREFLPPTSGPVARRFRHRLDRARHGDRGSRPRAAKCSLGSANTSAA